MTDGWRESVPWTKVAALIVSWVGSAFVGGITVGRTAAFSETDREAIVRRLAEFERRYESHELREDSLSADRRMIVRELESLRREVSALGRDYEMALCLHDAEGHGVGRASLCRSRRRGE